VQRFRVIVLLMAALSVTTIASCTSSGSANPGPSGSHSASTTPGDSRSSGTTTAPTSPSTSPSTSSSTPADPRVAAALKAYINFDKTSDYAFVHPPKKVGDPLPPAGNFRPYTFDPARAQILSYVFSLTEGGIVYKGTPPTPRVSIVSAEPAAKPYPTVTMTDCPTAPRSWNAYYRATGKPTTDKPGRVKPPYLVTVKVIYYENHWGVQKVTPNASRTCTAP
jgi:hypothetical protein